MMIKKSEKWKEIAQVKEEFPEKEILKFEEHTWSLIMEFGYDSLSGFWQAGWWAMGIFLMILALMLTLTQFLLF